MGRTARAQGPALPPWLRRLVLIVLGLYLAGSAYVLWRSAVLTPYSDELDWIQRWRDLQVHRDWTAYLIGPHNENRMGWTMAALAVDLGALGGTNLGLILSGVIGLALTAAILAREAAQAAPAPLALPGGALAAMLVLMAGNLLDASTPINVTYIHATVFAVIAVVLAEGTSRRGIGWSRLAALLAAAAAAFGSGVGLAVWPTLAIAALGRRDWAWLALVLLAGAGFIGFYFTGQTAQPDDVGVAAALKDPLGAIRLTLNYLMLPWTRVSLAFAWIGGLVVATLGLAGVAHGMSRDATRSQRIAGGLILFSLGTAAMAGLGRSGFPDALNVPLRYGMLLAPLHVGFLMFALPYVGVLWRANRTAAQALVAAVLLLAAAQNAVMAVKVVRASDVVRTTVADFKAGARRPEMSTFVHPDQAYAERAYAELAKEGRFQHELHLKPPAPAR